MKIDTSSKISLLKVDTDRSSSDDDSCDDDWLPELLPPEKKIDTDGSSNIEHESSSDDDSCDGDWLPELLPPEKKINTDRSWRTSQNFFGPTKVVNSKELNVEIQQKVTIDIVDCIALCYQHKQQLMKMLSVHTND